MTFRRAARALLLFGFVIATAWSGAAVAAPGQVPQAGGPAMWKLRTEKATVYFLGSFHILPPSVTWRDDPRIDAAFREAGEIVFEVDLDEMDKPEMAAVIVRRATLPDGKTLKDVLTAGTYTEFALAAGKFGMPLASMERMQPWLAASGLLVGYMTSKGANPGDGVDGQLTREARAAGKQVIGLESVEEQLDVLDTLSGHDPDLMITDMIRFVDESTGLLQSILTAWRTGDEEAVDRLMRDDLDKHEGVYDRFITSRNAAWVPEIESMIRKGGTYFVVVGAGHLVGDESVIAMLRAKGYAVERF